MKKIIVFVLMLAILVSSYAFMTGVSASLPTMNIAYCNLSFRDTVCIKYAVRGATSDVKLLIWTEPQTEYVIGTQDDEIVEYDTEDISGVSHKVFDYTKLAAKQMTDVIYARAYAKIDGVDCYSEVNKYSILQYAYNKLGKTATASDDSELKEMLTHMLAYGAAAQKYLDDYKVDRLATAEWYQVKLTAGLLDDGCTHGLYLPGDIVTMIAPDTNAQGVPFSHWADSNGTRVATTATYELVVGSGNEVYTPVYAQKAQESVGLEFESEGDGTCYVVGMGDCTDTDLVIPAVSPEGDIVIGIAGSAFANEAITSVSFPNTIKAIERRAFNNCSSLTDVYYDGTEEEWEENVEIGTYNTAIVNATKHFKTPEVKTFTVTFVDFDGRVLKTETVESGKSATAPADPTRDGYVFTGWDKSFVGVTSNLTVTALYERVFTSPAIVVENVKANAGDTTVDVVIALANNPGIASLKFDVTYDSSLTLNGVTFNSAFGAYVTAPTPYKNPQTITCISPLAEVSADGTFATLTFDISNVTVGSVANITVTPYQEEIYDENFDPITFEIVNGSITR